MSRPSLSFLRRRGLRAKARSLVAAVAPSEVFSELEHRRWQQHRRELHPSVQDPVRIEVDPECVMFIFWSEAPGVGSGPSSSTYVYDSEVLRLDCFGGSAGHMHLNPMQMHSLNSTDVPRIFFPEEDRAANAERARFEFVANLHAGVASNHLKRVRSYPIDKAKLPAVADQMYQHMIRLIDERDD